LTKTNQDNTHDIHDPLYREPLRNHNGVYFGQTSASSKDDDDIEVP
jgi:hypothetical protein